MYVLWLALQAVQRARAPQNQCLSGQRTHHTRRTILKSIMGRYPMRCTSAPRANGAPRANLTGGKREPHR
eukprot:6372846-Prymnesium_polylepis.1